MKKFKKCPECGGKIEIIKEGKELLLLGGFIPAYTHCKMKYEKCVECRGCWFDVTELRKLERKRSFKYLNWQLIGKRMRKNRLT